MMKKAETAARINITTAATIMPTIAPMEMPEEFWGVLVAGVVVSLIDLMATMCSGALSTQAACETEKLDRS